ncbi:MAG: hypothetical protein BWY50_01485 [Spirochaetes bacterium ADurb.Bin315]|nr:MAG: hypothetical protein BWY50_01485 [Spirochaetes bacterium ADurb.Bin315]
MILVKDAHQRKDRLLDELHHLQEILVHRVALQSKGVRGAAEGEAVVGFDRLVAGDSGHDRLPASGIAGKIMGFDAPGDNHPIDLEKKRIQRYGCSSARRSEIGQPAPVGGDVADDPVVQASGQPPAEQLLELRFQSGPMSSGGDENR